MNGPKVALVVTGTLAIILTGYFGNEWRVCNGLKQDLLATATTIRRSSNARFSAGVLGVKLDDQRIRTAEDGIRVVFTKQLENIYSRCGMSAGDAAIDEAEITLFSA